MCGILSVKGNYRYESIPEAMTERGRDDYGIYEDEHVQLIQTRLHITGAKITLPVQDERYVALFNGQIYNWQSLAKKHDIEAKTDFDIIIPMYRKFCMCWTYFNWQGCILIYDKKTNDINVYQDKWAIRSVYKAEFEGSTFYSSNLRSLPKGSFKFNKNKTGIGDVSGIL